MSVDSLIRELAVTGRALLEAEELAAGDQLGAFLDDTDKLISQLATLPPSTRTLLEEFVEIHAAVLARAKVQQGGIGARIAQLERSRAGLVKYSVESRNESSAKPGVATPILPRKRTTDREPL